MIADGDGETRAILARKAVGMGLIVEEARDADQTLSRLHRQPCDVLVADLNLAGCSGLYILQEAHKLDPHLQVILLSSDPSLEAAIEALRAGAFDHLSKPLTSTTGFEVALRRALRHRQLLRENALLSSEVERLAVTDPLTGLVNRHPLIQTLELEIERARRYQRPLCLILIDLDRLQRINDEEGQMVGDRVLQCVAAILQSSVRKVDLTVRQGGDEFLIVLPEATLNEGALLAGKVLKRIAALQISSRKLTASAGVLQWEQRFLSAEAFLEGVEQTLALAKRAGGNSLRKGVVEMENPRWSSRMKAAPRKHLS